MAVKVVPVPRDRRRTHHLDVDQLTVRLVSVAGEPCDVDFFLHLGDSSAPLSATLGGRLNEPGIEFLPCTVEGKTFLQRLDRIAYIELEEAGREISWLEEIGAREQSVELHLVNGERIAGSLLVEGDEANRRVSDYLNCVANRFVLVRTKTGAKYVYRGAITRVHFEESK